MPTTTISRVRRYLDDLDRALRDLPRDRRQEIVRDIHAHIDGALADFDEPTEADVEQILDGLGTPEEIAQAAYEEQPARRERIATRDLITVILLLAGGFLFFVGWIVGVVMLWSSNAWRTRDKVIGTLLVPGGLLTGLLALFISLFSAVRTQGCSVTTAANGPATSVCSGGSNLTSVIILVVVLITVIGPFFSMVWLLRTARRG